MCSEDIDLITRAAALRRLTLAAQQRVLGVRANGGAVLQDVVAAGEVLVLLGACSVLRTKGGEVRSVTPSWS